MLSRLKKPPVISLSNATFYRTHPSSSPETAKPLFPKLTLSLPSTARGTFPGTSWGIIGASSGVRTDFLNILRGQLICDPPTARSYPYLLTDEVAQKDTRLRSPLHAIQYVGFDADRGVSSIRGSYLSQRYESKREITDFSLRDYLLGHTELNAAEDPRHEPSEALLKNVIEDLKLEKLLDMPVNHLSNGQTRRSRIAKALLASPEVLLLDSPFMGLDITTVEHLSYVLQRMAQDANPRIVMSLKSNEYIPTWLTKLIFLLDNYKVDKIATVPTMIDYLISRKEETRNGHKALEDEETPVLNPAATRKIKQTDAQLQRDEDVMRYLEALNPTKATVQVNQSRLELLRAKLDRQGSIEEDPVDTKDWMSKDGFLAIDMQERPPDGESLIEMEGVKVAYGDKVVLGNWEQDIDGKTSEGLHWTVKRGQRWVLCGPNGSGKTTLTALMSSDHPQSFSLPMRFFGKSRLPSPGQPGISFFDIQKRIGFSSPELHAFFPKQLSIRQTLESAWADAPLSKPKFTSFTVDSDIAHVLDWFRGEICPDLGPLDIYKEEMFRPRNEVISTVYAADEFGQRIFRPSQRPHRVFKTLREQYIMGALNTPWADERTFGSLSPASQRVLLFLRAIIKRPDIVILDEAFSGMDSFTVQKCHTFLSHGDTASLRLVKRGPARVITPYVAPSDTLSLGLSKFPGLSQDQALVMIAHREAEVPGCVRHWLCLPEPGEGQPRSGVFDGPVETDLNKWRTIWDLPLIPFYGKMTSLFREYRTKLTSAKQTTGSTVLIDILDKDLEISRALSPVVKELSKSTTQYINRIPEASHDDLRASLIKARVRAKLLIREIYYSTFTELSERAHRRQASILKYREILRRETPLQRQQRLQAKVLHAHKNRRFRWKVAIHQRRLEDFRRQIAHLARVIEARRARFDNKIQNVPILTLMQWAEADAAEVILQTSKARRSAALKGVRDPRRRRGMPSQRRKSTGRPARTTANFVGMSGPDMIQSTTTTLNTLRCQLSRSRVLLRHYRSGSSEIIVPDKADSLFQGMRAREMIDYLSKQRLNTDAKCLRARIYIDGIKADARKERNRTRNR